MTVYDFISLCTEGGNCDLEIFDLSQGETVYSADADWTKIPHSILDSEVQSFDPIGHYGVTKLVLNI